MIEDRSGGPDSVKGPEDRVVRAPLWWGVGARTLVIELLGWQLRLARDQTGGGAQGLLQLAEASDQLGLAALQLDDLAVRPLAFGLELGENVLALVLQLSSRLRRLRAG